MFTLQVADHVTDATSKGAEALVGGTRNIDLGHGPPLAAGGGRHGDDTGTRGDIWTHRLCY